MIVKLTTCMSGDRFVFKPGMVIECTEKDGERLIAHGAAVEAVEGAAVEGELKTTKPLPRPRKPDPGLMQPKGKQVEKAAKGGGESAATRGKPATCRGSTKAGNPCKRAPAPDEELCPQHLEAAGG